MRNSVPTANPWGDIVGYSRAVRVGNLVFVSGTTASGPEAAVAWLRSAQNEDGGYGEAPGAESGQSMTGWAMLGFEAAGVSFVRADNGIVYCVVILAGNAP